MIILARKNSFSFKKNIFQIPIIVIVCALIAITSGCASTNEGTFGGSLGSSTYSGDIDPSASQDTTISVVESKLSSCQQSITLANGQIAKYSCVSVMFGTNRATSNNSKLFYGKSPIKFNQPLKYGEVVVSIPDNHQPGSAISGAEGPVDGKNIRAREKFFTIWDGKDGITELTENEFAKVSKHKLKSVPDSKRRTFVFIHGYNVSFEGAAYRTAQLKADLEINAPAYFFSWPSNSNTQQYISDQDDVDLSVERLVEFLETVKKSVGEDVELNLIAHSLGNRLLGKALDQIKNKSAVSNQMFDLGIFASADLDENLFRKWIGGENINGSGQALIKRAVLYVTDDDKALWVSRLLRRVKCSDMDEKFRVGLVTKKSCAGSRYVTTMSPPFYTVDLSFIPNEKRIDIFENNHAKYVDSPRTICHVKRLIWGSQSVADDDAEYLKVKTQGNKKYWIMDNEVPLSWERDCNIKLNQVTPEFVMNFAHIPRR